MIAIPGHITSMALGEEDRLQDLFRRFGNARRRTYALKQKSAGKDEIERILQEQTGLNSRYAKDALYSVKDLPSHVTFGGLRNQRLREAGKISKEEYRKRRNSIIISRGDKSKKGNLNTRIVREDGKLLLRVNVPPKEGETARWIYPKVFIPRKYLKKYDELLEGLHPYTVYIKRRDNDKGYSLRVVVETPDEGHDIIEGRVMALDVNAGHMDFAVAEPHRVLATGKINCHEAQYAGRGKTENLLHKVAEKIINIARHYKAKIVIGNLNTGKYRGWGARKIKGIPHHKLAHILEYKYGVEKRSEAYTTKLAEKIAPNAGLDVHKVSACMFALKVLDYDSFSSLKDELLPRDVRADEGVGSPSTGLTVGSGLTAPCRAYASGDAELNGPAGDETAIDGGGGYPAIPGSWGLPNFLGSLESNLPCLQIKIC
ncbi:MAG: hypothetical protein ACE5PM_07730 [Candidatus Hydrothermarchaeales archaeon]